jgi:hypothetical protein
MALPAAGPESCRSEDLICHDDDAMPTLDLPNVGARRYALWDLPLIGMALLELAFQLAVHASRIRSSILVATAFLLVLIGLTFWVRSRRSGITLNDEGLTSRRRNRTCRLRWNEIDRFDVKESARLWLIAIHPDGRTTRLQTYRENHEGEATSTLCALNGELHRRRSRPVNAPTGS